MTVLKIGLKNDKKIPKVKNDFIQIISFEFRISFCCASHLRNFNDRFLFEI